ncbi:MAG: EamA family transporter RarD [Deferribacteraceae bacterium]|jgi:chloramphenicol-sensitive protein RarD|nr:EamA family transporter RarD [Deferribacteraceae bacterium]
MKTASFGARGQSAANTENTGQARTGFIIVLLAFLIWGMLPLYWKLFFHIPPLGITSYRVFWSWIFVVIAITVTGQWGKTAKILSDKRSVFLLYICGILIGINWGVYIFSISSGHVIESSMGYYINPLVNTLFGALFFGERMRGLQKTAIFLALSGVGYMIFEYGRIPFFAILLAVTFAMYGAVHKLVKSGALEGMFYEMSVLIIPALLFLFNMGNINGLSFFQEPLSTKIIIMLAGPFTAIPLMGFAFGVQRLTLTTVGIIQYASPTATFLLGIFYFKEPMPKEFLLVFCLIWLGILMYLTDRLIKNRGK